MSLLTHHVWDELEKHFGVRIDNQERNKIAQKAAELSHQKPLEPKDALMLDAAREVLRNRSTRELMEKAAGSFPALRAACNDFASKILRLAFK